MDEEVERQLIAAYQAGDMSAFSALFEAHNQRVLRLALQFMRDEQAALDISQEVFMRAYEELKQWRGAARFSTWLYRTALNVCFERIRAEEKQRKIRDRLPPRGVEPSSESHVEANEIREAIDAAIESLPPRQRMIFILKQYEEKRFSEIALLLDITEGGAKASYHKALMALLDHLKQLNPDSGRRLDDEEKE